MRRNVLNRWLLPLCLLGFGVGCIPIIDRFAPEIELVTPLQQSYSVQDTIRLILSFGDNDRVDSAIISIRRVGEASVSGQIWNPTIVRKLRGRRIDDTVRIVIPPTAQLGTYEMTIRLFDFSKNQGVESFRFNVIGDQRPPIIRQLDIVGLPRNQQGDFIVCRQTVINLTGLATDNIRIREVRAEIPTLLTVTRLVNADSVRFDNLFGRDLRIPANIPDNVRLLLTITVIDHNNNSTSRSFALQMDCDDQPPQIRVQTTSPQINERQEASIIEGDHFRILAATITDNRGLARMAITFNPVGARRDTVFRLNLAGTSVQLGSILANQRFTPPAVPGAVYELVIFATDQAGNQASPFRIVINVVKDEPPQIIIAQMQINKNPISISPQNFISRGDTLEIFGKVIEDRALEYLQIFWGTENALERVVNLSASQLTPLPFDLADPRSVNRFIVPRLSPIPFPGSTLLVYILQLRAKDTRNPEVVVTYRFIVRN